LAAWILPKKDHKRMVTRLLQQDAHVVLCFRAEPKVEVTADGKYVEKRSLTGLKGWIPIAEKNLPFELTASLLLMADRPGFPEPIKLQEQHKPLVPLDVPLAAEVGVALASWAAGSLGGPVGPLDSLPGLAGPPSDDATVRLELEVIRLASNKAKAHAAIDKSREDEPEVHMAWLNAQLERLTASA
jgi:hypothetical protein